MNTRHHYLSLLRTFALATLTAAAVTACTDDNGDPAGSEPITPADGIPVTFTANINPGSNAAPSGAPGTRTVLTPTTEGGFTVTWKGKNDNPSDCDAILIRAAQGTTTIGFKTYVPTTSEASSPLMPWNDGEKLTLSSSGDWTFRAIYGSYSTGWGSAVAMVSPLAQSAPDDTKHIAENDFSVATATKHVETGDMPDIGLRFHHLLSALQLRITNQTGEELTIKEIRLSAAGGEITTRKTYDVAQGKWETTGEEKADYLQLTADNFPPLATGGAAQNLHMLLFPGYENKTLTITVITDRGEYTLTKTAPASPGFEAGKNYLTDITIKSSNLETGKETWTEYITSKADLIAFRERVHSGTNSYYGKTVRLTADINLENESWTPINGTYGFQGAFDGGGHHISGLNVNIGTNEAGLFGRVSGGTVRNLRVSGNVTTTGDNAGGIVGKLQASSTVENCIFSGTVNGRQYVGGIAGLNNSSCRIAGCHTKGSVTATGSGAGGIAGLNTISSSIDDCYSEAEVKASSEAGGIIGKNQSSTVTHCYATGKVSGSVNVGGIAGHTDGGTFTGCIALNPRLVRTSGAAVTFGRIVGKNYSNAATLTSCAAFNGMTIKDASNNDITGTTGEHGTVLTREQCLAKNTYTGFAEPTATKPGWAFDTATPWTYLPWNPAFETFSGISEANYKISASTLGTN